MARNEMYGIFFAALFHIGRLAALVIDFCAKKKECLGVSGTAHPAQLLGRHSAHVVGSDLFCGNVFGSPSMASLFLWQDRQIALSVLFYSIWGHR